MDQDADEPILQVETLSAETLMGVQTAAIKEINEVFEIPAMTAKSLLQHFSWDKDRLLERYYDSMDSTAKRSALYKEAQCTDPSAAAAAAGGGGGAAAAVGSPAGGMAVDEIAECEVCMEDVASKDKTGASCGHEFCVGCWQQHLRVQIEGQGNARIECPGLGCNILFDELTATGLLKDDKALLEKYNRLAARDFVSEHKQIKWCPSAGCDHAVKMLSAMSASAAKLGAPVACGSCKHPFCFGCSEPVHQPVDCTMLRLWKKKCADDSETANWISSNTKECPKCNVTIEKNGGCNHMHCPEKSCRYEFCWICIGPWEPHGSSWYNCSRFDEKDATTARDEADQSRQALKRYLFYFNRYANHKQSIELEDKLKLVVNQKMEEIQETATMSWIEVQFLAKALVTLRECRLVLMHTYVFAFYLAKNNEAEIFESNQRDLEMATETLSGYLEGGEIASMDPKQLKQQVQDKAQYCEQRYVTLLKHVTEGRDGDRWLYRTGGSDSAFMKAPAADAAAASAGGAAAE